MADETPTPMDNKELPMIKYLKDIKAASERTGDLVKNESTANSIIASALPEVLNDTRLYYARETLDTRQGLFEIDDYLRAILLQDAKYYGGGILMEESLKNLVKSTNDLKPIFTTISGGVDDMSNEVTESITNDKRDKKNDKKNDLTQAQRKEKSKEEYMKQTEGEKKTAGYFKGLGDKFDGFKKSFLGKLIKTDLILVAILLAISYFRPLAETIERFFRTTGQLFRGEIGFMQYIGDNFILMGGIALVLFRKTLSILLARVLLGGVGGIGFFAQLGKVIATYFSKLMVFTRLAFATGGLGSALRFLGLGLSKLAGLILLIPIAIFGFLRGFITGFDREFQRSEKGIAGFVGALLSAIVQGLIDATATVLDFLSFGLAEDFFAKIRAFDFGLWVSKVFDEFFDLFTGVDLSDLFSGLFSAKPVVDTGSIISSSDKEKEKNYLRRMQPNINNRTNINNFTTVNANNNSSRSDTTLTNRSVDNSNFSFNGTLG
jgi:hypothetical protein